jgi:hypothetical protein
MAELKTIEDSSKIKSLLLGVVTKIRLSHAEVQILSEASSPVSALTGLIPGVGPYIAAAIVALMWLVVRTDKKYGNRGVVIAIKHSGLLEGGPTPMILSPDQW